MGFRMSYDNVSYEGPLLRVVTVDLSSWVSMRVYKNLPRDISKTIKQRMIWKFEHNYTTSKRSQ